MKIIYSVIFAVIICFQLAAQNETPDTPRIWGMSGYALELNRSVTGNSSTDEIDRWKFKQSVFVKLNFRLSNRFFSTFESDFHMTGTEINTFDNDIRQFYITAIPVSWLSLTLGKQRLKWGTARVFNTIDKLEDAGNPFSAEELSEGIAGIKSIIMPADWLSLSLVIKPETELKWIRAAFRFDFLLNNTDLGIGIIKYNFNRITQDSVCYDKQHRAAVFFDVVRYFGSIGFYSEVMFRYSREMEYAFETLPGSYSFNDPDFENTPVFRTACGIHYQMPVKPKMNIILEYLFNSEGFTDSEAEKFWSLYKTASAGNPDGTHLLPDNLYKFGYFRKHYLFFGITDIEIQDSLSLGFSVLANLETAFFTFIPEIGFNINRKIYFSLKCNYYCQFTDKDDYPSLFNFIDNNYSFIFKVNVSY
jgi:hypothetical protein